jgi:hypothetical protein
MTVTFKRANKSEAKGRFALVGIAGGGKTYTALIIAEALGERIAVVDTEYGSASKYADRFTFDVINLQPPYEPERFIECIQAAEDGGYEVLILDSLTMEWSGAGGCLELHTLESAKLHDSYRAWAAVTPRHEALTQKILGARLHVIGTYRAKPGFLLTQGADGKSRVERVGMDPKARDGTEHEWDVWAEMDTEHRMIIQKTRCPDLDGKVFVKPGPDVAEIYRRWLLEGAPAEEPAAEGPQRLRIERPASPPATPAQPSDAAEKVKAAQRSIVQNFRISADDVKGATKAFLPEGKSRLAELTAAEADELVCALSDWAIEYARTMTEADEGGDTDGESGA